MQSSEIQALRELARAVKDVASQPVFAEKARLWKRKNSLQKTRPLIHVGIPEEAWPELMPAQSFVVQDPFFHKIECDLRKKLYKWERIRDDEVITDRLYVPILYSVTDWIGGRVRPYTGVADRSARFSPSLKEYADLKKLRAPEVIVDRSRTEQLLRQTQDALGDIMTVCLGEPFYAGTDGAQLGWGNSLIDVLCELRGLEQVYFDLTLAPEFIKEAMEILCQGTARYLDAMENEGLLRLNNNEYVNSANTPLGSNGLAFTDELPGRRALPDRVTCADLWGYFQAQEFAPVSAEMLEEFILPYQARLARRFGLNCYGCCEPLDRKWESVFRHIPLLREVSVSHAADFALAVEKIRSRYVLSWKPNATEMITDFREQYIRDEMKKAFRLAADVCLVVCLRDTLSFFGEPQRLWKWAEITMELAMEHGE